MPDTHPQFSRRRFLESTTALSSMAMSVPTIITPNALGFGSRAAASDRINVGVIGLGARGLYLVDDFLRQDDVQVVALCDVDEVHHRDLPWGKGRVMGRLGGKQTVEKFYANEKSGRAAEGVFVTKDFRELCARKDIDAVLIATPDHWHALCTLEAIHQGKDVYCEKPVTHTFREGQVICRAVARTKTVFQTGSQQRSDPNFQRAVELVRNGYLGKIQRVEVGLPAGYDRPQGDTKVTPPPKHLDYEMWCGPSEKLPYMRARHHRWWRGNRAYGGGVLMDWIGHHNDIAHWAMNLDESGPISVEASGWVFPDTDVYDTPQDYQILCEYPGGISSSIASRHRTGTKWIGEAGWVFVTRGTLEASNPNWVDKQLNVGPRKGYSSAGHTRNFLECVKSRATCIAPAETAHRSITPGHLAYVSNTVGRRLHWNSQTERIMDDAEANAILSASNDRQPWTLQEPLESRSAP